MITKNSQKTYCSVSHEGSAPRSEVTNNCYINAAYNWMSPELMAGEQPSELSDVYSLCSVMWEIIHGKSKLLNISEPSASYPIQTGSQGFLRDHQYHLVMFL